MCAGQALYCDAVLLAPSVAFDRSLCWCGTAPYAQEMALTLNCICLKWSNVSLSSAVRLCQMVPGAGPEHKEKKRKERGKDWFKQISTARQLIAHCDCLWMKQTF